MSQDSPDSSAWDQHLAQIDALRDEWRAVTHGLNGDEAPSPADRDSSDAEEHWTVAQIHSHVVSGLLRNAAAFLQVVIAETGTYHRTPRHLPDGTPYSDIRRIEEHAWAVLLDALQAVALRPDPGAVIALDDQTLTS